MVRFSSYQYVPIETRRILRDRFASKLPVARQDHYRNPDLPLTPDLIVFRLLEGLTISRNVDWVTAAAAYSAFAPSDSEHSDLDALAEAGWVRKVWDRVRIPMNLRIAVGKLADGVAPALKALVAGLHQRAFTFDAAARSNPELADLIASVDAGDDNLRGLNVLNPGWVAARLWEVCLNRAASPNIALRTWVDLCTCCSNRNSYRRSLGARLMRGLLRKARWTSWRPMRRWWVGRRPATALFGRPRWLAA